MSKNKRVSLAKLAALRLSCPDDVHLWALRVLEETVFPQHLSPALKLLGSKISWVPISASSVAVQPSLRYAPQTGLLIYLGLK